MIDSKAAVAAEILRYETIAEQKGWTASSLCRELGINRGTWQRWKDGDIDPKIIVWERLKHLVASLPRKPTKASVASDKG